MPLEKKKKKNPRGACINELLLRPEKIWSRSASARGYPASKEGGGRLRLVPRHFDRGPVNHRNAFMARRRQTRKGGVGKVSGGRGPGPGWRR